ncbi:hypothetical protein F5Y13DRAFT_198196 [Hypoxylon sp. FL1857]|nr:hypothetical protein F5Y13DRAFT_198196 [Hypoxylon sp. FL1857]
MTDVILADCTNGNDELYQAAYYRDNTESTPEDITQVATPNGQRHVWENSESWAYFADTSTNFTARLGPKGEDGEYSGSAYNGYAHFNCYQQSPTYVYGGGSVECYPSISVIVTTFSPLSRSTSNEVRTSSSISPPPPPPSPLTINKTSSSTRSASPSVTGTNSSSVVRGRLPTISTTLSSSSSLSFSPTVNTTSPSSTSTSSPTVSTTSLPSNNAPPPPSNSGTFLSTTQVIGIAIGVALCVLSAGGVGAFAVWKGRKRKGAQNAVKPLDEQLSDTFEERKAASPRVEADGLPAGGELDAPLPIRELYGRSCPAEIHGCPVAELEGDDAHGHGNWI